ncbi:MAG: S8 family serine peptidase, partial [Anaerolineae bacterium]
MIRRVLWRATTALIVLTMAVPLVQAAPTPAITVDEPAVAAPKAGPPESKGAGESKWKLVSSGTPAVETTEPAIYIIQLEDAPVASYRGGIEGLEATNPGVQGQVQLDASSPESIAYNNYLEQQQERFIDAMERSVERSVEVRFQYRYAYNGVAAKLTAVEAAVVARLPGVVHVERDTLLQPTTDVGPAWIGAEGIWDGTTTGGLPGTKGERIVAGILDTGINMDHPSFAATGDDGYTHVNPLGAGNYIGLCATEPATYVCNSKLIGAWDFVDAEGGEEDGPEDHDGHGSHTASTVAGNVVYSPTIEAETITVTAAKISGVAPHANIIAYDVCHDEGCPSSATMAAKDQAIIDGVDVINYSIGGGASNPWTDAGAVSWLNVRDAGIFAVTSAGNDGPDAATMGSPGTAPWILTVGATTHNRRFRNALIDMDGGGAPPDDIEGKSITSGYGPAEIVYAGWYTSPNYPDGSPGCMEPFPAGTFDGEIVVCDRGEIARVAKGENVLAGGAGGLVLANAEADAMQINADAHVLPAVHITYSDGLTLKAWLTNTAVQMATIAGTTMDVDDDYADIIAAFSSRGPNPAQTQVASIIKPDLSAPGVDVFAASRNGIEFESMGGTSMSSPHVVGAGALIRAVHPDWTPAQIQSALMMTAWNEDVLKEDEMTPADPFDTGAGRVDLSKVAMAGLVLDEATENFEDADPELGGDPTTLNLASLGNDLCLQQCSWERTFRSTVDVASTYTAVVDVPPTMIVMVDPMTFTVPAYGTQVVEVEADVSAMPVGEWAFGEVSFETDASVSTFAADWEQGFEGAYPPAGWATHITGDPADPGFVPTTLAHWGNQAVAHFDDDLDTAGDSWLVSPQFAPTAQTQLAFWQLTYWDSYYGYHGIWVSDGSADPDDGDFVELAELDNGTGATWQRVTQSLEDYAGTPIYVAFRYQGDYADWWVIDDVLVGEMTGSAPISDLHMPMAVRPSTGILPNLIDVETRRNAGSQLVEDLQSLEITDLTLDYYGLAEATLLDFQLSQDPTHDIPGGFFDDLDQVFYTTMTVAATNQRLVAEIVETTSPDLDMAVGRDVDGDGPEEAEIVCQSATGTPYEYCDISGADLVAGDWWIIVMNWQESANPPDDITLAVALVGADSGDMTVTGPDTVPEKDEFDLRLFWDEPRMEAGDHWYGAISIGTDPAHPGNVGTIPLNLLRRKDDVTKSVSPSQAEAGDTVTYTISIQPDITGQELTYYVADTMPDGVTYVPGSATAGSGTLSVVDNRLTWSGQVIPPREYMVRTSLDDPLCTMPLATSGAYVDLEAYGFGATPGIEGDNVAFQDTYPGGPFAFFGDPRTNNLYFTDDGYASLDLDSVISGPFANASIPTADLPNALMAMLWNDMEIVYEAGTGESNRGVTAGIYLTTGGVPTDKLLEFDDIQKVGDPSSQLDFEMLIAEAVNDAAGEYEVIFAYDNLTGDFNSLTTGTIGVEDYDGSMGTQYAYNDANLQTLEDGMAICFDYVIPPKPVEITYQATVDADASGTLVNEVWHNTNNPGSRPAMVSAEVAVAHKLYLPLIFSNYTPVPAASPSLVHLSWAEDDVHHTIAAVWWTGVEAETTMVYDTVSHEAAADYQFTASGEAYSIAPETDLDGDAIETSFPGQFHEVDLTGLEPGTLYYFRVGGNGVWSREWSFRTIGLDEDVKFVAGGDSRRPYGSADIKYNPYGISNWPYGRDLVSQGAADEDPHFVWFLGDMVDSGNSWDNWQNWLESMEENLVTDDGRMIPIVAVIGNHEVGAYPRTDNTYAWFTGLFANPGDELTFAL